VAVDAAGDDHHVLDLPINVSPARTRR